MISVYRIYMGQSWYADSAAEELLKLFDTCPEFLYNASALTRAEAEEADKPEAQRAAVRLGMTQAHVLVLPADADQRNHIWTGHEIAVARTGFRQRIPILMIGAPGASARDATDKRFADLTVPWSVTDIACGIQAVVEAAVAERRAILDQIAATAAMPHAEVSTSIGGKSKIIGPRPLPTNEIVEALTQLRASRHG